MNIPIPQKVINDYNGARGCHPGVVLKNLLNEIGLSQRELAMKIYRPYQAVNEIVRCRKKITAETALQLEMVLPGSAHFWMDIQITHDIMDASKKIANSQR
jgi:HTH-type transcriptional regulator/antitoxin HigA